MSALQRRCIKRMIEKMDGMEKAKMIEMIYDMMSDGERSMTTVYISGMFYDWQEYHPQSLTCNVCDMKIWRETDERDCIVCKKSIHHDGNCIVDVSGPTNIIRNDDMQIQLFKWEIDFVCASQKCISNIISRYLLVSCSTNDDLSHFKCASCGESYCGHFDHYPAFRYGYNNKKYCATCISDIMISDMETKIQNEKH